ncbi:MAG: glycosyl hydrolase [Bacteroidia bacterium]
MLKSVLSFAFLLSVSFAQAQLKFVVYDFDGLNLGQTDLPDGDFMNSDLTYNVAASPLAHSDVIGDRVLQLNLTWQSGAGDFGKTMNRFIQLDAAADRFNFYIYNPTTNNGSALMQVSLLEDDNQNNIYESSADDKWISTFTVSESGGWQLISLPLSGFQHSGSGGNNVFDAGFTGNGGMIFNVDFKFTKPAAGAVSDTYYIDMICFSEGALPHGAGILDLPAKNPGDYCMIGALSNNAQPDQTPGEVESLFSTGKKLSFVNWFTFYAATGTTPNDYTGTEVQTLLSNGYRPVITWEMIYDSYSRLDPVQPRLDKIVNGTFDSYLDAFAAKIKSYSDTVIIRIFHEFEGNWYSWSLTENNNDPSLYISAFRHVVDRFRNAGASKVKWMWCLNAEPKPYRSYNWVVGAYPGDNYVDIVATDIYNHPDTGIPDWKSFRYTAAESYYYLNKYFPNKPLYICEVGCRERDPSEPASSQSKADWLCDMNNELQSYFNNARALIFFSLSKEHDWRINSSQAAEDAFKNCFWNNPYYGKTLDIGELSNPMTMTAYPNPFTDEIRVTMKGAEQSCSVSIYDMNGKMVRSCKVTGDQPVVSARGLSPGLYIAELSSNAFTQKVKLVKTTD